MTGTSGVGQLGAAFDRYVTSLREAWTRTDVAKRADACRRAMEVLLAGDDPEWAAAVQRVASGERKVELYRDPDHGFIQMAHQYRPGHGSPPHGHGDRGWVVYGVQLGRVEIATYRPTGADPPLRVERAEVLAAGEARAYLPGEMHSTRMVAGEGAAGTAVVLRMLSEDLSKLDRLHYDWRDVADRT
ncbi:MAG: hypothetical protein KGQ66_20320 [Acidobacteriota bacterium]|nr:hypothetical protein [Acidobacteriota bacterium]